MKKHEAYEHFILKRRIQYLEFSDEMADEVGRNGHSPFYMNKEFSDINTLASLIEHLTNLKKSIDEAAN